MDDWPTGRLLSVAARLVEQRWRESLERIGLSHAGLIVLHLVERDPLPLGELARRARVTAQTMGRTVEHLERSGYVRLVADPSDRRRKLVERTEEGGRVFDGIGAIEATVFPTVEQAAVLRMSLLQIIRHVGGDPEAPGPDGADDGPARAERG
ncbi:MarR family transcriptional regulator [Homoserinibacter sp. GY 40078]|nr:MarR family transcriptional regulator [Homoserinibacter sp. GY 40078]